MANNDDPAAVRGGSTIGIGGPSAIDSSQSTISGDPGVDDGGPIAGNGGLVVGVDHQGRSDSKGRWSGSLLRGSGDCRQWSDGCW